MAIDDRKMEEKIKDKGLKIKVGDFQWDTTRFDEPGRQYQQPERWKPGPRQ